MANIVKKVQYEPVEGTSYPTEQTVTTEPGSIAMQPGSSTGVENYILDLDPEQVGQWSYQDVVAQFVNKLSGCEYAGELFLANRINGKSLMLLREEHLQEMGIQAIGDRVYMLEMVQLLKKKKKELQTTATLWSGETPADGCAYNKNCWHCIRRYTCPCCVSRTYWKVTGQGVFYRKVPPCRQLFGTVSTEYMDSDLQRSGLRKSTNVAAFCQRYKLEMFVDDKDHSATERGTDAGGAFTTPHVLRHPEAPQVEKIIRNAWSNAHLVAL
uniref:SAM domain-containing protein n=1 Tax=Clytia hemisphaerica TaxID=252671 RepID=A0A7M5X4L7_9CNID